MNPHDFTEDERFDRLWDSFKEKLRKARGEREAIYTMGENSLTQRWGSRFSVGTPTADENGRHFANIHTGGLHHTSMVSGYAEDMVKMAAHLMASAEEITAANESEK